MIFNITHKHSQKEVREKRKKKKGYLLTKTKNSLLYLLPAYQIYPTCRPCSTLPSCYFVNTYLITTPSINSYSASIRTPSPRHGCESIFCPPWLFASWRPLSCSLKLYYITLPPWNGETFRSPIYGSTCHQLAVPIFLGTEWESIFQIIYM